jgi:hypothetical protein
MVTNDYRRAVTEPRRPRLPPSFEEKHLGPLLAEHLSRLPSAHSRLLKRCSTTFHVLPCTSEVGEIPIKPIPLSSSTHYLDQWPVASSGRPAARWDSNERSKGFSRYPSASDLQQEPADLASSSSIFTADPPLPLPSRSSHAEAGEAAEQLAMNPARRMSTQLSRGLKTK